MKQMSLDEAQVEAEAAMAAVDAAAAEEWKAEADEFIHRYLRANRTLFCDDLWTAGLREPSSPRALGPRLQRASKAGWMRKTGEYRPSTHSHGTVKPVWESLLYGT